MERNMMCNDPAAKGCWYKSMLVFSLVIFASTGNAAWQSNEPPGVEVTDFALAPSKPATVIATSEVGNRGIYTSITSGASWSPNRENSQGYYGAAIKADNFNYMLAGVADGVIRFSVDGGLTWADTSFSDTNDSWIIEFSASSVSTVYAAGFTSSLPDTGIVQKSTNATNMGLDWAATAAIGGDLNPPTFSLAVAATDADTVYVGAKPSGANNDGLYKTTDGAASWSYLSALNITQVDALAVDPTNPDYVYAGTAGSGFIQRSVDGGANWVILHDPNDDGVAGFTSVRGLAINPVDRRIIYAVGGSGATKVIVSTDCGASWRDVDSTGLLAGLPDKVLINPDPDPVSGNLVMVRTSAGAMYRETLITAATGDCSANTGTSRGGGGSGAFDYLLLGMLMLIGVARYRTSLLLRS
jgi:hypothetical protein